MTDQRSLSLRTKMLGAILREVRLQAGKSIRESAELIGVGASTFSSYEHGRKGIPLPELEIFAYANDVPIDVFWTGEIGDVTHDPAFDAQRSVSIRQRLIGVRLRMLRQELGRSIKDFANAIEFPPSRVSAYERGERAIPLPELEIMAESLGEPIEDFIESEGPIGNWIQSRQAYENITELPIEVQKFVADPGNLQYLKVAMALSDISAERLHELRQALRDLTL